MGLRHAILGCMYKHIIKPILFLFSPDFIHSSTILAGRVVQTIAPMRWLLRKWWSYEDKALEQDLLGVTMKNPVGLSAGFDKSSEVAPLMENVGFGFASAGSMTLEPRRGNKRPWFHRLPKTKSLVIFAGMPNKGLLKKTQHILHNRKKLHHMPTVMSLAVIANKTTIEAHQGRPTEQAIIADVKKTTEYILEHQLADVIELNISCPNAGREPFLEPKPLEALLAEIGSVERNIAIIVKMPHLEDIKQFDALLKVIVKHNIQGVTVANLVKDRSRVDFKEPLPDSIRGGLSGMPTQQHSLELIRHAYKNYGDKLTIIGVGGIFSAEDAYAKIKAGASLTALITGVIFEGPQLVGQINKGLIRLMKLDGFSHISEAIGADYKKSVKKSKNL